MSREDVREDDLYEANELDELHGDEALQRRRAEVKQKAKRERKEWRRAFAFVMSTENGRTFVWGLLGKANYFSGCVRFCTKEGGGAVDPIGSALREGRRQLAIELQQNAMTSDGIAEDWIKMITEGTKEDRKEQR